jgi:hypothetical protein
MIPGVDTSTANKLNVNFNTLAQGNWKASWYSPRDGSTRRIAEFQSAGIRSFQPPGMSQPGNDWVLVLDRVH